MTYFPLPRCGCSSCPAWPAPRSRWSSCCGPSRRLARARARWRRCCRAPPCSTASSPSPDTPSTPCRSVEAVKTCVATYDDLLCTTLLFFAVGKKVKTLKRKKYYPQYGQLVLSRIPCLGRVPRRAAAGGGRAGERRGEPGRGRE